VLTFLKLNERPLPINASLWGIHNVIAHVLQVGRNGFYAPLLAVSGKQCYEKTSVICLLSTYLHIVPIIADRTHNLKRDIMTKRPTTTVTYINQKTIPSPSGSEDSCARRVL